MEHKQAHHLIPVTPYAQNCSLVWCAQTKKAVIIDPGGDVDQILAAVKKLDLQPEKILLTHGHLDHVGGSEALAQALNIPIWGPTRDDLYWFEGLPKQSQMFGFPKTDFFEPARWLTAGDVVEFGERRFEVLHCPGHTPGHICFWDAASQQVWVGDVLFAGSVGRSDFPGGDHATLIRSIREQLLTLGDDVQVFSGHGPSTSIGEERRFNPFIASRFG